MPHDLTEELKDALTGGPFSTADHVRHEPTGEDWIVAYHDPETDDLAPCGWPPCIAKGRDCTLIKAASPHESVKLLGQLRGDKFTKASRIMNALKSPAS